jgi:nitronate monooxygenase
VTKWSQNRICDLLAIELPIIQAPMAGSAFAELAIAVSTAGGLGSLACAMLNTEQVQQQYALIRAATTAPLNLNFFCHQPPRIDNDRDSGWRKVLEKYYREFGLDPSLLSNAPKREPFDAAMCDLIEELKPEVVSFHFGLPEQNFVQRIHATGAKILSSATTVDEARWLEQRGCDAIIAMGCEAGGHRAMFLTQDINTQIGTLALVPQVVDAVRVPVIAAGGVGDARGIAAAFMLGAAAVQIGTAYLFTPEVNISAAYRATLIQSKAEPTALTNIFSGRPARGIVNRVMRELGPMSDLAPQFPLAGAALAPLRQFAEAAGSGDFSPLWAGQALQLGRVLPAAELTRQLAEQARVLLSSYAQ